jgi:hypothetical protein
MRLAALGALVVCVCACGEAPAEDLPRADFARFVSDVQPVLEARCANPSCHGNENRALDLRP